MYVNRTTNNKTKNLACLIYMFDTSNNGFLLISNDFVHKYIKFKFHSFNVFNKLEINSMHDL